MKLVFLDFDGVLRPYTERDSVMVCHNLFRGGCAAFDPACVAELNLICSATDACIVVSSSWRNFIKSDTLMSDMLHEQGVDGLYVGMTPLACVDWHDRSRGAEISRFMRYLNVESFVILDDDDMDFDGMRDRVVNPNCETGLSRRDAIRAIEILTTAGE